MKDWELHIDGGLILMISLFIIIAIMFGILINSSTKENIEKEKTKQYELQLQIEQQHNINKEVN